MGCQMNRPRKILLSLSPVEEKRLQELVNSYQLTTSRRVTMSDVIRRSLFALPVQPSLNHFQGVSS